MTIYICGDSTADTYDPEKTLMVGWGQLLQGYLPHVRVEDRAKAGRSTKSFLAEGRLEDILREISPGDLMLVQFAHNDENEKPERHTEPWTDYLANLTVFVDSAREKGAIPVLLTPICMRVWQDGKLKETHGDYKRAVRALAEKAGVPCIDLYAESFRIVQEMGEEGSKALFMHVAAGEDPRYPEALCDNAHTRFPGADRFAAYVAQSLKELKLV